jgi:prepilin-type N-terminal cleavage/methylation domain-containing protein
MTGPSSSRHGYTIVELMMAIAVMAIGVTGIIAMQKVTLTANQHAKHLSVATQIASAWLDMLAADALQWNTPGRAGGTSDLAQTNWLNNVNGAWFRPAHVPAMDFGPGFDGLGNPVADAAMDNAVYCTHLRLNWLVPEVSTVTGNGLIRAEVRVFWLRDGGPGGTDVCSQNGVPDTIGSALETYHFVHLAGAIRQNTL